MVHRASKGGARLAHQWDHQDWGSGAGQSHFPGFSAASSSKLGQRPRWRPGATTEQGKADRRCFDALLVSLSSVCTSYIVCIRYGTRMEMARPTSTPAHDQGPAMQCALHPKVPGSVHTDRQQISPPLPALFHPLTRVPLLMKRRNMNFAALGLASGVKIAERDVYLLALVPLPRGWTGRGTLGC